MEKGNFQPLVKKKKVVEMSILVEKQKFHILLISPPFLYIFGMFVPILALTESELIFFFV